jgi:nicotinate-nucleotide pyrophosphorylase (carboxylating)
MRVTPLPPLLYERIVRQTLKDDLGRAGDVTTDSIVAPQTMASARIVARCAGCLAGIDVAVSAFRLLDPMVEIELAAGDGDEVSAGQVLAMITGSARALLQGERTALNFLGHLSGIATTTRAVVRRVKGTARVLCTRKTTPGLGFLEKYAVRAGGGFNHRFGLDDGVLIKENHLAVVGSISEAVRKVRSRVGHMVKVEVEVETLDQLREALSENIDAVLLDNMSLEEVKEAVDLVDGRVLVEVSGGITPESVVDLAEAGVDLLSMGWLTHSSPSLDVALEIVRFEAPAGRG